MKSKKRIFELEFAKHGFPYADDFLSIDDVEVTIKESKTGIDIQIFEGDA